MIVEVQRSLAAAWRIMRHDEKAVDDLNLSIEGFWRSFAAVIPILPMMWIVSRSINQVAAGNPNSGGETISITSDMFQVLLTWVAWPVVVGILVHLLKLGAGYVRFVVAYNWVAVIIGALTCLPHLLHLLGILPFALAALTSLFILGVSLYYSWYLARVALGADAGIAAMFAFADLALAVGIGQLIG